MSERPDYFGTDAQKAVLRRGRVVYELVKDDPRCTYYGRGVGVMTLEDAQVDLFDALITLQGTSSIARVAPAAMAGVRARAEAKGLSVTIYERWTSGDRAVGAAREVVSATPFPKGLSAVELGPESPNALFEGLAQLAAACGVMLPSMAVLRGTLRPGVCLVAVTENGACVSCAAGAAFAHGAHPTMGHEAWWGMLATAPPWRGRRLALLLGARTILSLRDKLPDCTIITGVQNGNAASEAVCAKLGLAPDGDQVATHVDPSALPSGKLTR